MSRALHTGWLRPAGENAWQSVVTGPGPRATWDLLAEHVAGMTEGGKCCVLPAGVAPIHPPGARKFRDGKMLPHRSDEWAERQRRRMVHARAT